MTKQIEVKQIEIGKIPEEWKVLTVGDFADIVGGGTPSTKDLNNFGGEIPWITPKDLSNYPFRYIQKGERNITKKGLENSSAKLVPKGTVLLTTRAPVGYVAIAENEVATNQGFRSLIPKNNFYSEFIYYILKLNTEYLKSHASGTTFGELSGSTLKSLKFLFPPLKEQRAIASILGSLDDKIAINRSMNSTLEAIGQALFKRWFVDFEFPDGEGRPYRSSGGEMVESELGMVPKGWSTKKIRDLAAINEKSMDRQYKHDAIEYIDISSVTVGRLTETKIYTLEDVPSRAKRIVKHGDTIWSTVRPNLKSFLYIDSPPENLVVSTGFAVLTPKHIPSTFLYHWVTTVDFINYLSYRADGSAYPAVNTAYIADADIIFPSQDVLTAFDKVVSPMQDQIAHNEKQSRTLAIIRDALLPKLMSGEIRTNAEQDHKPFINEIKIT